MPKPDYEHIARMEEELGFAPPKPDPPKRRRKPLPGEHHLYVQPGAVFPIAASSSVTFIGIKPTPSPVILPKGVRL